MGLREHLVAGTPCLLDFSGFHRPLGVLANDAELLLAPWTYQDHLDALRACTHLSGPALRLDVTAFADRVLAPLDLPAVARPPLHPVALWWAAGGDAPLPAPPAEGDWLDLGSARARLRPWTERQRLTALDASLDADEPDSADPDTADVPGTFDPVGYLDAMVRASLTVLDGPVPLARLDARATAVLLHATVALNVLDETDDTLLQGGPAAREAAARTLRLCRALGWTPARVWATPATEVDRLLRLLDLIEPPRPTLARPGRRGLADHPDATVIRFEDDAA